MAQKDAFWSEIAGLACIPQQFILTGRTFLISIGKLGPPFGAALPLDLPVMIGRHQKHCRDTHIFQIYDLLLQPLKGCFLNGPPEFFCMVLFPYLQLMIMRIRQGTGLKRIILPSVFSFRNFTPDDVVNFICSAVRIFLHRKDRPRRDPVSLHFRYGNYTHTYQGKCLSRRQKPNSPSSFLLTKGFPLPAFSPLYGTEEEMPPPLRDRNSKLISLSIRPYDSRFARIYWQSLYLL